MRATRCRPGGRNARRHIMSTVPGMAAYFSSRWPWRGGAGEVPMPVSGPLTLSRNARGRSGLHKSSHSSARASHRDIIACASTGLSCGTYGRKILTLVHTITYARQAWRLIICPAPLIVANVSGPADLTSPACTRRRPSRGSLAGCTSRSRSTRASRATVCSRASRIASRTCRSR